MTLVGPRRLAPGTVLALWALAFLGVWAIGLGAPFVYDDQAFLLENPLVTGPWPGLTALFTSSFAGQGEYGPLSTLGHWLLFHVAGPEPFLYRLTSLLLHAANSLLLFRVAKRLLGGDKAAFAAAALFSLYPAHAEVLALSSFKKHLGVAFFGLALLAIQGEPWPRARRRAAGWGCLALALLCKESGFILPPLAVIVGAGPEQDWRRHLKEERAWYGGLFLLASAYAVSRLFIVPRHWAPLIGGGWAAHLLTSAKILAWYAAQLPLPRGLCLEHTLAPVSGLAQPQAALLVAGLALCGNLFRLAWRRDRILGVGLAWCLLALAPFLNVLPYLNVSLVSDRYLYLASGGFLVAAVRLVSLLDLRPRVLAWAWGLLAGVYGASAFTHMSRFSDDWSLWKETALCAPDNARARLPLAVHYMRRLMYREAIAEYENVLALAPALRSRVYLDLGVAYAEDGRLDDAIRLTRAELEVAETPEGLNNLGLFYLRAKKLSQASKALEIAVLLDPGSAGVRLNLGAAYLGLGRRAEAAEELERAAKDPAARPKALRLLAELRLRRGDKASAVALYEETLKLDPLQWEAAQGLARLHARRGQRAQAAAVLEAYLGRIEALLGALRKRDRDEDGPAIAYAEGLRLNALEEKGVRTNAGLSPGGRARRSRAGGRIP